jgi:hypothetical protein
MGSKKVLLPAEVLQYLSAIVIENVVGLGVIQGVFKE